MKTQDLFDVTIIGGGPAGLYAAFYSGLREMKTKIIEYQAELGGKLNIYPEKIIWDVGGLPPVPGKQLREQLVNQGLTFDPEIVLNEKIEWIERNEEGIFVLTALSGQKHYSKTVIVAVGTGIITPQKLNIKGAERFEVTNLNYAIKSLKHFKNKTVIISGGSDSAVDWANELMTVAKKVYITYRKDQLVGHEAQVKRLLNSPAICLSHTSITQLITSADHEVIEQVELTNHETGEIFCLPIDEVVICHGYKQDTSLWKKSSLPIMLKDDFYIEGNAMGESSVPGLYAAGDILSHEGKLNLIAGAFQDAANAVNRAKKYIEPNAERFAMVSSHNDRFTSRNREIMKQLMK